MLKKLSRCFLLLSILLSQNTHAQNLSLSFVDFDKRGPLLDKYFASTSAPDGQTIFVEPKHHQQKLDLTVMSAAYVNKLKLFLYDDGMNLLEESSINVDEDFGEYHGIVPYGTGVFIIYSGFSRDKKTTSLYALKLNEKNLSVEKKIELGALAFDKNRIAKSEFKISTDSSKFAVWLENDETRKNKSIYLAVFDDKLNKIWSNTVSFPLPDVNYHIYDMDIDNGGKIFLTVKEFEEVVQRADIKFDTKLPAHQTALIAFSEQEVNGHTAALKFDGISIRTSKLNFAKDGSVGISGLYSASHERGIDGVFTGMVNMANNSITAKKLMPFPAEMVALIIKDGFGPFKKSDAGISRNFRLREVIKRPNGSTDIIAEYYRFNNSMIDPAWLYGDVINTNISKTGNVSFTRIPKSQENIMVDLYMGYFPVVHQDKLILFYNDNPQNISKDISSKPAGVLYYHKSVLLSDSYDPSTVLLLTAKVFSLILSEYTLVILSSLL